MPTTIEALLVAAYFVVPGFLFVSMFNLVMVRTKTDTPRQVLESLAASCVFWVLALVVLTGVVYFTNAVKLIPVGQSVKTLDLLTFLDSQFQPHQLAFWMLVTSASAVVLPAFSGWGVGMFVKNGQRFLNKIGIRLLTPRAWDFTFSSRKTSFLIVILNDGSKVGGIWGHKSYASGYPDPEDLFVEQAWTLDENDSPVAEIQNSQGVWISGASIRIIQFTSVLLEPLETHESPIRQFGTRLRAYPGALIGRLFHGRQDNARKDIRWVPGPPTSTEYSDSSSTHDNGSQASLPTGGTKRVEQKVDCVSID